MSLDPLLAFFALGLIARLLGSDLRLPAALYESVSLVLLLAIGLKGGLELAAQPVAQLGVEIGAVVALGVARTLLAFAALRGLVRLPRVDAAAVAAHYGSVSVGTFAVVVAYLAAAEVPVGSPLALYVVLLEVPAILVGVLLGRGDPPSREALREIVLGKSIVLLLGGLAIGWVIGADGIAPIAPLYLGGFKAVLSLFLLEMGIVCGERLGSVRRHGIGLVAFAVIAPLVHAGLGAALGLALGLGVGATAGLATLSASASYIAVPAALRLAMPEANPSLSLSAALGVTFPFNVLVGIPLYLELARWLHGGA